MAVGNSVDPASWFAEQIGACEPDLLRSMVKTMAEALMSAEADVMCGAGYGERSEERVNSRNGYREREWDTRAGTVELAIPKLRSGSYFPEWLLERRRRAEQALISVVATSYLLGVSTRRVDKLVEQLGIKGISKSQVSQMSKVLDAQVTAFRDRALDAGPYSFVWMDALTQKVREGGRTVNVHVLVATGVNADGHREILGVEVTSSEDGAGWLAFLRGLVARGLSGVQLVISDAHRGLVEAIGSTLPGAAWQRCRTHWSRQESTWRDGGEERGCGPVAGCGGCGVVAVVFQERAGLDEGVADGAGADLEQFAKSLACADFPLVEDGGEDSLGVGDLLLEDAASGSGESFAAASLVAEAFEVGGLEWGESSDHLVELFAAHPGQSGVGEGGGDPGPLGGDLVVVQMVAQLCGGGEPHGRGGDRDVVLGEQLAGLGDPVADGEVADLEHVRKDLLGADLAEVNHCDQHPVRV